MKRNLIAFAVLIIMALALAVTAYWYFSTYKPKSNATDYIANLLNDPESAQFRNVRLVEGGTVCGEINGKNAYGAYIGFTPFVYTHDLMYGFIGSAPNPPTETGNVRIDAPGIVLVHRLAKKAKGCTPAALGTSTDENVPIYFDTGTITVTLQGGNALQVGLSLKLASNNIEDKILSELPEIMAVIKTLLESKRESEMYTVEGKEKLASEIKVQIEKSLGISGVTAVLFTSFIML